MSDGCKECFQNCGHCVLFTMANCCFLVTLCFVVVIILPAFGVFKLPNNNLRLQLIDDPFTTPSDYIEEPIQPLPKNLSHPVALRPVSVVLNLTMAEVLELLQLKQKQEGRRRNSTTMQPQTNRSRRSKRNQRDVR